MVLERAIWRFDLFAEFVSEKNCDLNLSLDDVLLKIVLCFKNIPIGK